MVIVVQCARRISGGQARYAAGAVISQSMTICTGNIIVAISQWPYTKEVIVRDVAMNFPRFALGGNPHTEGRSLCLNIGSGNRCGADGIGALPPAIAANLW